MTEERVELLAWITEELPNLDEHKINIFTPHMYAILGKDGLLSLLNRLMAEFRAFKEGGGLMAAPSSPKENEG